MNCEEATEFSFRCPSCEESLTVNGPMRAALVERGCVVCGADLTPAAFTPASECESPS
jgi:ribosomal protein L37AE/L43A